MEKLIDFERVSSLDGYGATVHSLDGCYIVAHISPDTLSRLELSQDTPLKLEGILMVFMLSGTPFDIRVNQMDLTLGPGMLISAFPSSVVKFGSAIPSDVDAYIIYFDMTFAQGVNISLSTVTMPAVVVEKPRPVWEMDAQQVELIKSYMELLIVNTRPSVNVQINKQIASSLIAGLFYQLVLFYHTRLAGEFEGRPQNRHSGGRHDYVREFVRLVHLHYMRERSVTFYSKQLFISPKYLSMLVREATGRSAAKWIDDFVLSEAKNLLKFSGKNIQQVAYALNFSTQSSFGKYFKHLTGMSPTEYQKS